MFDACAVFGLILAWFPPGWPAGLVPGSAALSGTHNYKMQNNYTGHRRRIQNNMDLPTPHPHTDRSRSNKAYSGDSRALVTTRVAHRGDACNDYAHVILCCVSIYLSIIYLAVYPSVHLSLSLSLSIHTSIHPSIHLSICTICVYTYVSIL